ncbi:unnamed protein product [Ranitomeya imitator]|uniref:ribonuclease H n=1 Tax=Ranitomeya imitator TaxID=111125 RepID=A0ABN9M6W5_9NEOB|nr:unnamed protein product [Ranitomeya imitator]
MKLRRRGSRDCTTTGADEYNGEGSAALRDIHLLLVPGAALSSAVTLRSDGAVTWLVRTLCLNVSAEDGVALEQGAATANGASVCMEHLWGHNVCAALYGAITGKDDVDIDALAAEIEGAGASKEQKSKAKKKNKKKQEFEDTLLVCAPLCSSSSSRSAPRTLARIFCGHSTICAEYSTSGQEFSTDKWDIFQDLVLQREHFQFVALPFSLASAPRVFTKIMAALMAILRVRGLVLFPYLDDNLIKAPSFSHAHESLSIVLDALARFGWLVNRKKSCLFPSQRIIFLGMLFDTRPSERQEIHSLSGHALAPGSSASLPPIGHEGSDLPPEFSVAQFNGVAVETAVLRASGLSDRVIHTMIQARKPSSSRIYYRTWKAYFRWCESNRVPSMAFSLPSLLAFLQAGLDSGLALSSLKGQVSALSILFQKTLASRPQVKTFLQGVAHAVPPYRAPVDAWDLNLVLDVLRVSPFEPLREIPLSVLSWKVTFLVAITSIRRVSELAALSCRPPFFVIHQDKVVLRPPPSFLPKVVSTFHLNEDIILPSFCPAPTHPLERSLNKLDLVMAERIYLDRTSTYQKTDSFFVIPHGTRRGQPASKATIARWIRMAILEAYRVKNRVPPPGIKAHSTRAVSASWAVHHRASALQLCKAATWSSIHTFAKFYKVHTYASADASLGRRILQAAVKPEIEETEAIPPKQEKKKKGQKGKKASFDEDDDNSDEMESKNAKARKEENTKNLSESEDYDDDDDDDHFNKTSKKRKGKNEAINKNPQVSEEAKDHDKEKVDIPGYSDEDSDDFSRGKKGKKKEPKAKPVTKADSEEEGEFKIKTAAQKKAEKKERERKKREEEKEKAKLKKQKDKDTEVSKREPEEEAASKKSAVEAEAAEVEDDDDGDKKKKDKKKKKGEKEEKDKKKKGPSSATVKAMQEALAKMKEEEERLKREEEERQRRLEEMEAKRLEEERLEQERKEKKKQKEKERKERLKKEGKLLTKSQKEARARAVATLKVLQAQGVEVPSKDSVPKKKPIYEDKKKKKPQQQTPNKEEPMEASSPVDDPESPVLEKEEPPLSAEPPDGTQTNGVRPVLIILNIRYRHIKRRCSDPDNDPGRCSVAVWSLESCHTDSSPATNDAGPLVTRVNIGVTKRRAALSNPMFTLVTSVNVKKTNKHYILTFRCLSPDTVLLCTDCERQPESTAVTSPLCSAFRLAGAHSAEKHSAGGQTAEGKDPDAFLILRRTSGQMYPLSDSDSDADQTSATQDMVDSLI